MMEGELITTEKLISLRDKEIKELRIERAEHIRKIEQLEEQNEDVLLELASLKMTMSSSSGGGAGGGGGGGGDATFSRWSNAVSTNSGASGVGGDTGRWSNAVNNNDDWRRGEQEKDSGVRRRSNNNQRNISNKRSPSRNSTPNGRQDTMTSSSSGEYGYGDTDDIVPTTRRRSDCTRQRVSQRGSTNSRRTSRRGSRASICVVRHDDNN
jgi:hypothetical protein